MNDINHESLQQKHSEKIRIDLFSFITLASSDYNTLNNTYNGLDMPILFDFLKKELSTNKNLNFDVITLICNTTDGNSGWITSDYEPDQSKYTFEGIEQTANSKQKSYGNGLYSGKIAFRKELLEAAIVGGYLNKMKEEHIFFMAKPLPRVLKNILENCPNEILAYGKTQILANIEHMGKTYFLSKEESKEWKHTFEEQVSNYPTFHKTGFFENILNNIKQIQSNTLSDKKKLKKSI